MYSDFGQVRGAPVTETVPKGVRVGPGRWSAKGSTVEVAIRRKGQTIGSYVATGGRLTILHAGKDSVSGTVYANLRQRNGAKESQLNGTWSCHVGTG